MAAGASIRPARTDGQLVDSSATISTANAPATIAATSAVPRASPNAGWNAAITSKPTGHPMLDHRAVRRSNDVATCRGDDLFLSHSPRRRQL
jgi:hypothetical protein